MNANVGGFDRVFRIVAGLALLSLFFVLDDSARYWGLIGIVPLLTAVVRFCPLYSLVGINTCPVQTK